MKVKKAVILAGGLGTRFLPASKAVAKEMFPVFDKPILQYLVEELTDAGIEEVLLVVGKQKESVIRHFKEHTILEKRLRKENKTNLIEKLEHINNLAKISFVKNVKALSAGYAQNKKKTFLKS